MAITNPDQASRLARTIMSDIFLYYKNKIKEGVENDNLFGLLEEQLEEGRKLYSSRVDPQLAESTNLFNEAVVDVLIKQASEFEGVLW